MLGDRLRELRKQHHKTQAELGKLLGTDQSGYSKIENNVHSLPVSLLGTLANYYRINIDELLEFIPNNPKTDLELSLEILDEYGIDYSLIDDGITLKQNEYTSYFISFKDVPELVKSIENECNKSLKSIKGKLFRAALLEHIQK